MATGAAFTFRLAALRGDHRVAPCAALLGACFFLLVWWTLASTLGAADLSPPAAAAGVLAFAALWGSFGMLAVVGLPRLATGALVGHLFGYVILAANLVIAHADGLDTTFAVSSLFGATLLGLLAGGPFEILGRRGAAKRRDTATPRA